MFPRMVVGTADFAVSSAVHFSVSETAHPVFKTQWEKWERALYTHRQGWGGTLEEEDGRFRVHPNLPAG